MIFKIQRGIIPYFNPWNILFGPFELKVDPKSDGFANKMQNLMSTFFPHPLLSRCTLQGAKFISIVPYKTWIHSIY